MIDENVHSQCHNYFNARCQHSWIQSGSKNRSKLFHKSHFSSKTEENRSPFVNLAYFFLMLGRKDSRCFPSITFFSDDYNFPMILFSLDKRNVENVFFNMLSRLFCHFSRFYFFSMLGEKAFIFWYLYKKNRRKKSRNKKK